VITLALPCRNIINRPQQDWFRFWFRFRECFLHYARGDGDLPAAMPTDRVAVPVYAELTAAIWTFS
jgi:hypothetical protein